MSGRSVEFPPSGDILQQFPELQRARGLFIDLFKDRSPLVSLGYTSRQIGRTMPVLQLIEGDGKVEISHFLPNLSFQKPRDPNVETATIDQLPDFNGYYLYATNERRVKGENREERLWDSLKPNPNRMFETDEISVAQIILFKERANVKDLKYLVKTVIALEYFPVKVQRENFVSRFVKEFGLVGTFQATWLDNNRTEFVVKAEVPNELTETAYYHWKLLKPISDRYGVITPVGQKPNISHRKIDKILTSEGELVLAGSLAWRTAEI